MKPQFFKEGVSLDFRDKDTLIKALGGWIVELGEIESTFKSDIQKLKAFLTGSVDEIRRPYARAAVKSVRRTSFCGSCNSSDFLVDTSGNRRFWTVEVQKIDLDRLRGFDVVQLWKQVQSIARNDRQGFRLTGAEQAALAQRNTVHERKLPGQSEIEDILNTPDCQAFKVVEQEMTTSEFKILYDQTLHAYSTMAIGKVLDRLGRPSKVRKIDGKAHRLRRLPRRVY